MSENKRTQSADKNLSANVRIVKALPSAADLKNKFKTGSVPLQTDFADLIDIADIGRQAVGESGWGLKRDEKNRLSFDPKKMYYLNHDLSLSNGNDLTQLPVEIVNDKSKHYRTALLAINERQGPTVATAVQNGSSTTYSLNAVKIDSLGRKNHIVVKIIAEKAVESVSTPFEYVWDKTTGYRLMYRFRLDTSTEDFSNCTLVIEPLILLVYFVNSFSSKLSGEVLALLTVNFTFNGNRQLIPRGLVSMFSGSKIPDGWALCDGTQGTPNLVDRFIFGSTLSNAGKSNGVGVSGSGGSITCSKNTSSVSVSATTTVESTILKEEHIPAHDHSGGMPFLSAQYCANGYTTTDDYKNGIDDRDAQLFMGADGKTKRSLLYLTSARKYPLTSKKGGGKGHVHAAKTTTSAHSHSVDIMPRYYTLAFIMKL